MPEGAHVSSLDAIEAFRSSLIIYLSQARPALDEVSAEVLRIRMWLEHDQKSFWENQLRHRAKLLEQAQQALFSARLGVLQNTTSAEQFAVRRAKDAVVESDLKLKTVRKWDREFEGRVQPLVKQMEKLHTVLSNDMVRAIEYLTRAISTLADYAETNMAATPTPGAPVRSDSGLAGAGAPELGTDDTKGKV